MGTYMQHYTHSVNYTNVSSRGTLGGLDWVTTGSPRGLGNKKGYRSRRTSRAASGLASRATSCAPVRYTD
eukprot:8202593-Pyramimonas_sp.AAC.1